jgi:hypothetical protein
VELDPIPARGRGTALLPRKLTDKWDRKLYAWALWSEGKASPRISSAYTGSVGTNGTCTVAPSTEVLDTDALMLILSRYRNNQGPRLHRALQEWATNRGTRGEQAARLSIHADTYRDRVESAIALLELFARARGQFRKG